jgi:hypothetical protein
MAFFLYLTEIAAWDSLWGGGNKFWQNYHNIQVFSQTRHGGNEKKGYILVV